MDKKLQQLIVLLQTSASDKDAIEQTVTGILVDELFDTLPESIQDVVFFLDMYDLELPSEQDIKQAADTVLLYLQIRK